MHHRNAPHRKAVPRLDARSGAAKACIKVEFRNRNSSANSNMAFTFRTSDMAYVAAALPLRYCISGTRSIMLRSLLRPCHTRLTTRHWQKHAWFRTHCQPTGTDSKPCRIWCRPKHSRIVTRCAATEHATNVSEELPELTDQRMSWRGRSIGCGEVNESHIGQRITVCGWVHRHRGLGGVVFCDIRDSSGLLQVIALLKAFLSALATSTCFIMGVCRLSVCPLTLPIPTWRKSGASMLSA